MNKDTFKKHHFWLLAGIVPVLVLLAVVLTWTGVSGEISAANGKIDSDKKTIAGKKPQGSGYEKELQKQKDLLGTQVGKLWKANADDQRDLIVWPKDSGGRLANFLYDPA